MERILLANLRNDVMHLQIRIMLLGNPQKQFATPGRCFFAGPSLFFCKILWVTSHFSKYFMGHYFVFVPPETKKYFFPKKKFFPRNCGGQINFLKMGSQKWRNLALHFLRKRLIFRLTFIETLYKTLVWPFRIIHF